MNHKQITIDNMFEKKNLLCPVRYQDFLKTSPRTARYI